MAGGPLISVVIPVRNRPRWLEEAVQSALAQDLPAGELEVLVVDDGSDPPISAAWTPPHESVRLLEMPHGGVSAARNHGIEHARGEWVALLDSDDAWTPGKLTAQLDLYRERRDIGLCFTNLRVVDEAGELLRASYIDPRRPARVLPKEGPLLEKVLALRECITSTVVMRRDRVLEAGGFDPRLQVAEDGDLFLRVAEASGAAYLPIIGTSYRRHAGGLHYDAERTAQGLRLYIEKARRRHEGSGKDARRALDALAWLNYRSFALSQLRARRFEAARRFFRELVAIKKLHPEAWAGLVLTRVPILAEALLRIADRIRAAQGASRTART